VAIGAGFASGAAEFFCEAGESHGFLKALIY
jgi:hypothetical protein